MKWPWTKVRDEIANQYESRTIHLNSIEAMLLEQLGTHARIHLDKRLDRLERRFDEVMSTIEAEHRERRIVYGHPTIAKTWGIGIVEGTTKKRKARRKTK